MSDYSITVRLNLPFNQDAINKLIHNNYERNWGIKCCKIILEEKDLCDVILLDEKQAMHEILNKYNKHNLYSIAAEIKSDTYLDIIFFDFDGYLGVIFTGLSPEWSCIYEDDEKDIDIEKYIYSMLSFVHSFKILSLNVKLEDE